MYCSACDEVLVDNITIPATGVHTEVSIPGREATCTEEGLTEGKNYYVVLVATDESGTELATYNHQTFSTREDSSEYHDERVTHTSTVPVEQPAAVNWTLIILLAAGAAVLIAAGIVLIVVSKKRKVRVEK